MASPFPGMDPFPDQQEWSDFHATMITVVRELLVREMPSDYVVRIERRIYLEHELGDEDTLSVRVADIAISRDSPNEDSPSTSAAAVANSTRVEPTECLLPLGIEQRESYLVIRHRESQRVVAVIELLSPGNKRAGADGRRIYLEKRTELLATDSHLVEIDLLRGGQRLPMRSPLPAGDYYAIVSRAPRRPRAEVYAWRLEEPLPSLPIPLLPADADATVDLQSALATTYERAQYQLSLDYQREIDPPLEETQRAWLLDVLEQNR